MTSQLVNETNVITTTKLDTNWLSMLMVKSKILTI